MSEIGIPISSAPYTKYNDFHYPSVPYDEYTSKGVRYINNFFWKQQVNLYNINCCNLTVNNFY